MKKIILLMTSLLTLLLGALVPHVVYAEDAQESITLPIQSDPDVMNPLFSYDSTTGSVLNGIYDVLFNVVDGEVEYRLAKDLQISEDHMTYTLTLNEGMTWHDGTPITAKDVVFSINAILDPEQESYKYNSLIINEQPIEAKEVDELTVEITLPEVSVPFLVDLSKMTPIPEHIYNTDTKIAENQANQNPIGSGPYMFGEHKSGEYVTVNKYEDYYRGEANIDQIVYRIIADPEASVTAMLNGELDYLSISNDKMELFEENENTDVYVYDNKRVSNMIFKLSNEDLQNENVRKAIAYAINREELIEGVFGDTGLSEVGYSFYPPGALYYTDDVEKYEFDTEKAQELLNEEGYGAGDLTLRIGYTSANNQQETFALIIQQQLAEIGVNVELIAMERGAFVNELVDSESTAFDLAFNSYALGEEPSKYAPLLLTGNQNNFMGYSNPEVDELFAQGIVETDEEKRAAIYEEIQQIVLEDMVIMPIDYPANIATTNKRLKGFTDPDNGRFFSDMAALYVE